MKLFIGVCILLYLVQCKATNGIATNESPFLKITVDVPESNTTAKLISFFILINKADKAGYGHEYAFVLHSYKPGAFNGTHIEDVDDDFYPIEEIDEVQVFFEDYKRFYNRWISNFTMVLEAKDGSRSFVTENPGEKLFLNRRLMMKVVPEKTN